MRQFTQLDTLTLLEIVFSPRKRTKLEHLVPFTASFTFGKAYLLDGWAWHGGETLMAIVAGLEEPTSGTVLKNGSPFAQKYRRQEAWYVRRTIIRTARIQLREPSVRQQVRYGLRTFPSHLFVEEGEVIGKFNLTPARFVRPLRQFSTEGWRASCAVGAVNGRTIFCFPYMRPDLINEYCALWLKELLDLLKSIGALVLMPTTALGVKCTAILFDEVVPLREEIDYPCE
jgi:hypothetical protein